MNTARLDRVTDRVTIRPISRRPSTERRPERRRHLWTLAGGVTGSLFLFWVMVQLGQASSDPQSLVSQTKRPTPPAATGALAATPTAAPPQTEEGNAIPSSLAPQGPAIDTPREVIAMLDQRKKDLDRREAAIREEENRLLTLKSELEELLSRSEAMQKRLDEARKTTQKQTAEQKKQQEQFLADRKALAAKQTQEQKSLSQSQLAKMYESMPAEEAAARLEKMPERKALEILRLVKGKTAGAILAQVRVDRAAKLTEQLLAQNP
ncbi:MAG: hypothetical protein U0412_12215 [Nitrospira sp.]